MSFAEAQKKNEFWHAYYENKDERFLYKEEELTPRNKVYMTLILIKKSIDLFSIILLTTWNDGRFLTKK